MCFLTIHTKTVHDCLPRVECTCGGIIGSAKALLTHYEHHVKQSPSLRCELCKKCYKTIEHYDNHMLTRHSDDDDDRKFTCECGKSFKEARHLTVHSNSHLPDDQKFVHLCTYCEKRYSSIFSLRQHIKHVHVNVSSVIEYQSFKQEKTETLFSFPESNFQVLILRQNVLAQSQSRLAR